MSRSKRTDPKEIRAARRLAGSEKRLRIREEPPSPGRAHGVSRSDIHRFLAGLGPMGLYGLREIVLTRTEASSNSIVLGTYEPPGRIVLYEQPIGEWRVKGNLSPEVCEQLLKAGARIESRGRLTEIEWPGNSLRDFMLNYVLMHELGHHALQHYEGKRKMPRARTRDHEAFAELFVRRQAK